MADGDWLLMFQRPTRSEEVPEEEQEEENEQQPVGFQDTLIHTDRQTVNQSTNRTDGWTRARRSAGRSPGSHDRPRSGAGGR